MYKTCSPKSVYARRVEPDSGMEVQHCETLPCTPVETKNSQDLIFLNGKALKGFPCQRFNEH